MYKVQPFPNHTYQFVVQKTVFTKNYLVFCIYIYIYMTHLRMIPYSMFFNWRHIFLEALQWCVAWTFTDKTFCVSLFTSNNPRTHLHSEGDGAIWQVKLEAVWQGQWAAAFIFEWNRLLVQVKGNERDLTTFGLGRSLIDRIITRERAYGPSVCLCFRLIRCTCMVMRRDLLVEHKMFWNM